MYIHWYFAWMYVCVMVSPGTGVPYRCELPGGFWELKLCPLEAQPQLSHLSSPGVCSKFIVISQNISCSWAGRNFIGYGRHLVSWAPLLYHKCQDKLGVPWRQLLLSSAYKSDPKHSSQNPSTWENRDRHIYVSEFEASLVCRASTCVQPGLHRETMSKTQTNKQHYSSLS